MSSTDWVLPPAKHLQTILSKITETLARSLADSTEQTPDWSEFEWVTAQAVAAMHGISPLLSHSLSWRAPEAWNEFLRSQRLHTANRHAQIDQLLHRIDERTTQARIPVLALKGAALHAIGLYAVGDRPMADVDLLVQDRHAKQMAAVLEAGGFRQRSASWKERVFTPVNDHVPSGFGEHSNNDLKVELHVRICERLPWRITDETAHIFPSNPRPGLNDYPSKASLMLHLLLHAAGAMPTKTLRCLQLHDIALLAAQMEESDWEQLLSFSSSQQNMWWAFPSLKLASRYYPAKIPARVLAALARLCPLLLRTVTSRKTLYDVSYSYPWVDAFPGIEWSQSLSETLAYAANRLRPSENMLASRAQLIESQAWANQGDWARMPQSRRMLRWLRSRPTRPVTMHAVVAAVAAAS
ncbi:MAG: hypothetical protein QOK23_3126 [Gammaproteobacteria bacterium]|jgi:hypothetical protein|nr:hypothetical protein [Gammaproteobacteria bacterium]